jgi:hypothetical protein
MRMLVGILNLDRVQTNVEISRSEIVRMRDKMRGDEYCTDEDVLVHGFEDACDAQIVFEFDDDRLVGQSLEHAEHQLLVFRLSALARVPCVGPQTIVDKSIQASTGLFSGSGCSLTPLLRSVYIENVVYCAYQ